MKQLLLSFSFGDRACLQIEKYVMIKNTYDAPLGPPSLMDVDTSDIFHTRQFNLRRFGASQSKNDLLKTWPSMYAPRKISHDSPISSPPNRIREILSFW